MSRIGGDPYLGIEEVSNYLARISWQANLGLLGSLSLDLRFLREQRYNGRIRVIGRYWICEVIPEELLEPEASIILEISQKVQVAVTSFGNERPV